jgi:hypothetical protein
MHLQSNNKLVCKQLAGVIVSQYCIGQRFAVWLYTAAGPALWDVNCSRCLANMCRLYKICVFAVIAELSNGNEHKSSALLLDLSPKRACIGNDVTISAIASMTCPPSEMCSCVDTFDISVYGPPESASLDSTVLFSETLSGNRCAYTFTLAVPAEWPIDVSYPVTASLPLLTPISIAPYVLPVVAWSNSTGN